MARTPWTAKDGETLKRARKAVGISQAQLGLAVGVTSSRICECERVDFPGGRHCSPGKELGSKISAHLTKLVNQAAKRAEKAQKAEARKAEKVEAKTPEGETAEVTA